MVVAKAEADEFADFDANFTAGGIFDAVADEATCEH